ncbi:MAG: YIP1 family protein [Candidatus Latescibacterota bacterium]|nr:YIP1 family protein [Candidatus Latescibacterota bacterium]
MEQAESVEVEVGLVERWKKVFTQPDASFDLVVGRERAQDWIIPILLTCLVGIAHFYLTIDLVDAVADRTQFGQLDEVQSSQHQEWKEKSRLYGWTLIPVGHFTSLVFIALVIMVISKLAFQAELNFRQALIAKAHATLIIIPEWIVLTLLMLWTGSTGITLGPGIFFDESNSHTFLGRVLIDINFFDAWQVWVLSAAISVFGNIQRLRATATLGIVWVIWLLVAVALEGLVEKMQVAQPIAS